MSNIPDDVVVDILSQLPVKSLLRFKSVSKSWLSLVSDPKFAVLQFNQTAKNSPPKILISTPSLLQSLDCLTNPFGHQRALRKLDFPIKTPYNNNIVRIIGSCNGLICIALDYFEKFFIWNPSTGTCKKLPNPNVDSCYYNYYGFGYDSLTNNYKVFLANNNKTAQVLSTETNSWRRVQLQLNFEFCCPYVSRGILVNGSLHWLTREDIVQNQHDLRSYLVAGLVIIAFDLAKEKLSTVPKPSPFGGPLVVSASLGDFDGRLCLIRMVPGASYESLWMMQEYGVQASWKKLHEPENNLYEYSRMVPLYSTRSNQVILMRKNENKLIRCNLDENNTKPESLKLSGSFEATAYTESLI